MPAAGTPINRSITANGTAQQAMPANQNRFAWKIINDSTVRAFGSFTGTATPQIGGGNFVIDAGGAYFSEPNAVETTALSVITAGTDVPLTIVEF